MGQEFRNEKIYRILEEKDAYYVVRLKAPGAPIFESEALKFEPAKVTDPFPGGKEVVKTQFRITSPETKSGLKIEMPEGAIPGGASNKQAGVRTDLRVDHSDINTAGIKGIS